MVDVVVDEVELVVAAVVASVAAGPLVEPAVGSSNPNDAGGRVEPVLSPQATAMSIRANITMNKRFPMRAPSLGSAWNDITDIARGASARAGDCRDTERMTTIESIEADITALEVDAIVNAANTRLQHGGGLAAAISRAGGPVIQQASDDWVRVNGPLTTGTAAVTPAGEMPSTVVIHVAGPIYSEGADNERLLRAAIDAALDAAVEQRCRSVAIPAVSAGVFGYPLDEATSIIARTASRWCETHRGTLDRVFLVGFDRRATESFARALA